MDIINEIKKVESKIADLETKLHIQKEVLAHLKVAQGSNRPLIDFSNAGTFRQGSVAASVEAVLKEKNRAMDIYEIEKALVERGVTSSSKTGLRPMISSVLSKNKEVFIRVKYGVYSLKAQQGGFSFKNQEAETSA
jgi:hypothetical protein